MNCVKYLIQLGNFISKFLFFIDTRNKTKNCQPFEFAILIQSATLKVSATPAIMLNPIAQPQN